MVANGVRDRISPELTYFYHSLGFAAQYYQQDQQMQLTHGTKSTSSAAPLVDVDIDGFYFLTTYLLTGEQRTEYSQQIEPIHDFDPSAPMASPGAWELLFRVERLEVGQSAFDAGLANGNEHTPNRSGHECTEVTTGVNWYLNKWVRAQFNWEHAEFDGGKVQIGNAPFAFSKEDALYTRFQVIF